MANLFQKNNPKRQKLMKPLPGEETPADPATPIGEATLAVHPSLKSDDSMAKSTGTSAMKLKMSPYDVEHYIRDLAHLKETLLTALQLELSTIPPYLCGLYTIKDGSNVEAGALIRSVVVEEMLHMVLVSNLLNAITDPKTIKKGQKLFDVEKIIPKYPTPLPGNIVPKMPAGDPPFQVQLLKFSGDAIDEFITIERPGDPKAPINYDKTFDSIGQFYEAIRFGIRRLNENTPGGIFTGDPARQVTPDHYYGSGGKIVKVVDYETASEAIAEIVGQGEGIDGTIVADEPLFGENIEYAHYFKFLEIRYGRMYSANDTNFQMPVKSVPTGRPFPVTWSSVYNMKPNPTMDDYKDMPELHRKAVEFNQTYVKLLTNINDAVSGQPDLLIQGIQVMYELKYQALELLNIPWRDGMCAGPTFQYVPLPPDKAKAAPQPVKTPVPSAKK